MVAVRPPTNRQQRCLIGQFAVFGPSFTLSDPLQWLACPLLTLRKGREPNEAGPPAEVVRQLALDTLPLASYFVIRLRS